MSNNVTLIGNLVDDPEVELSRKCATGSSRHQRIPRSMRGQRLYRRLCSLARATPAGPAIRTSEHLLGATLKIDVLRHTASIAASTPAAPLPRRSP